MTQQLILLFGLMAFGYFLNKVKILDTAANGVISRLLVNAAIPATIIHSSVSGKAGPDGNVIRMFAIAICFYHNSVVCSGNSSMDECISPVLKRGFVL